MYHVDYLEKWYAMEYLEPAARAPNLIREMEHRLSETLWSRAVRYEKRDAEWRYHMRQRIGLSAPEWSVSGLCVTHGDCTVSNAMRRDDGVLVVADPVRPRPHVPRCREVDMGRLMQSALGWECVAYGDEPVEWDQPEFWSDDEVRSRALFWGGVTALRIRRDWDERGLLGSVVKAWCDRTAEVCFAAAGV